MKKKIITYTLVVYSLLLALACPIGGTKMPEAVRAAAKAPPGAAVLSRAVRQETPDGTVVYGKTALGATELNAIDTGIRDMNDAAVMDGFKESARLPGDFFEVYTPPYKCILSPVQRIPSFLTNGGSYYDGSEYDQYNTQGRLDRPYTDANGLRQEFQRDDIAVIFAAEMLLSLNSMYLCPDMPVLVNGAKHGAEHMITLKYPYTPEFRDRGPFDDWVYVNCSLYHGAVNHPLLPRQGRCEALPLLEKETPATWPTIIPEKIQEIPYAEGSADAITAGLVPVRGVVIKAVK